jgi:flagellar motor switch protein FliG
MHYNSRNLRKAAVLLTSLDEERAAAILAQMAPAPAAAVRRAMDRLGYVDASERDEVIEEFFRLGPLLPARDAVGIELTDPRCAEFAALAPLDDRSHDTRYAGHMSDVLAEASAESLAAFLSREQPQTIAVLISHLSSRRAAEVLAALPSELQIDVARRVVELDEPDPAVLREIERGLQTWLTQHAAAERRRIAGLTALGNILDAVPAGTRQHILTGLGHREHSAAPRSLPSGPPSLTFGDLEQLDGKSLGAVLRRAHGELLVLALAGARAEFVDRAVEQFPPTKAQLLRRALSHLGPTRLSDIEEAQRQLTQLAEQMMARAEITPCPPRHLSVAV